MGGQGVSELGTNIEAISRCGVWCVRGARGPFKFRVRGFCVTFCERCVGCVRGV